MFHSEMKTNDGKPYNLFRLRANNNSSGNLTLLRFPLVAARLETKRFVFIYLSANTIKLETVIKQN